ncbi:4-(cytidine 5'-diphospho)-2-C-methyl-D-erythritol kinase [Acidobacteriota bacterium]
MYSIKSYAKINLWLEILRKREDGFHEVRTLLQTVDLYDDLHVRIASSKITCECAHPGVPSGDDNLVVKAAELLREAKEVHSGAAFHLEKRILPGGGLGGGSSNAAMALLLLNRLWRLNLSQTDLLGYAARLGSDVPFFLVGGLCLGIGRGEEVYPLEDIEPFWIVLTGTGKNLSTREVYEKTSGKLTRNSRRARILSLSSLLSGDLSSGARFSISHTLENQLEDAAALLDPDISGLKKQLMQAGAEVAMLSGSGSTVFALFRSRARARIASDSMEAIGKTCYLCPTLCRSDYHERISLKEDMKD